MKICFSGGGTLGPVTPLLAIRDIVIDTDVDTACIWIGTKNGPERDLMPKDLPFYALPTAKFRRYFSPMNLIDLGRLIWGMARSIRILLKERPDVCVSAGGFVSVPVHWAAWLLGIPTWVHQQDVQVGLANKMMVPFATQITTALESQVAAFNKKKTRWLGNPIRQDLCMGRVDRARERFNLRTDMPVIFAVGGGTGSMRVNELVTEAARELDGQVQFIHLSGKERPQELIERAKQHIAHYHPYQFFTEEMKDAYVVADLVIARGGFGTLSELAALKKSAIIIPKPGHQEKNVASLAEKGAIIRVNEKTADGNVLARHVRELLDTDHAAGMGERLNALLPPAKSGTIMHILTTLIAQ